MILDGKKGNSHGCSLFITGLLITCLYLFCNRWSLSSQNSQLIKELNTLADQLRINGEELEKCSQDRYLLDKKLKASQSRFVEQQIKMDQVKEVEDEMKENYQKIEMELQENKKKNEETEKNSELCQAELESLKKLGESKDKATEALRTENESLKSELEQKKEEIKNLEMQLKSGAKKEEIPNKNKFMQSLVKNYHDMKKKSGDGVNEKTEKDSIYGGQQTGEKVEEGKNYVDPSLLSFDNDPREIEMKDS